MEFVGNDPDATFRIAQREVSGYDTSRKLSWMNLSRKDTNEWVGTIFQIVEGDEITAAERAQELQLFPMNDAWDARIFTAKLDVASLHVIGLSMWVDKFLSPEQAYEFDAWCETQGISKG